MGLSDVYESVQASLIHRIPLPTLDQVISELLSKETRLGLISTSHVDTALATPGSRGRGPFGGSRGFSTSGPGHYHSDCPKNSTRRDTHPQSTTATTGVSSTASAFPNLIDVNDLFALVQQIMSVSNNPSTALSASSGISPWIYGRLFSSSAPPYLIDPSIELFPKDVDVPADLLDDSLHAAPPTIIYLVESPSTDSVPPIAPPICRSTRVREIPSHF
ncbi:hypothetical protein Acr_00g0072770 [Actinidia rufa]|uniref:Uncharacterized protein n=1 Tax=Actinidia rufa TaxID=165716 RepID=A0A7J0DS30_9ERIC|nr:hypothetical protein Acr_00g0072770 [Actinidia rufa]